LEAADPKLHPPKQDGEQVDEAHPIAEIGHQQQGISSFPEGVELVELKKILKEIKTVNFSLVGKEKLMSAIKSRSRGSRVFAKEIDSGALISSLYEKQAILEGQKRINGELSLRMDSLTEVQENQEDLAREVTANAARLLQQQEAVSRMRKMEQAIKQQRTVIGQLEHSFEKSEMDKRVNEALEQQRERLDRLRERKQDDLKRVYRIIKENNQQAGGLFAKYITVLPRVKHAEEKLIKLNEQYARLTSL
jgi:multidrug efflux pump subunit AcrA (membrane-fusion protein)